jgi:HAD superfamily hydrolase (TIGR01509 family)
LADVLTDLHCSPILQSSAPMSIALQSALTTAVHTFDPLEQDFAGFIFDCDGTIADSMPLHFRAWRAALAAHGATFEFTWDLHQRRAGKALEVIVEELNIEFGTRLDANAVARAEREMYLELLPMVRPVKPVVDLILSLAGRRSMAVASGSDLESVRGTLQALGLLELLPVVVTAFDVKHGKPAPDLFLLAAERIGVAPSDCVVFEDSALGIEAAERAGMHSVLVRRLTQDGQVEAAQ